MGWKCSLVIIENKENFKDDFTVLKSIGKGDYKFDSECTLDECIYPRDESINIGYYKGNVIISDDYQLTTSSLERAKNLTLTSSEKGLVGLFPTSEIITVACHSGINYHGYSVIQNGKKIRLKTISSDDDRMEFGTRIEEENTIYDRSFLKKGVNYWTYNNDPYDISEEDQLMEEFTFKIAARRLGFRLDYADGEELIERVNFKKYISTKSKNTPKDKEAHAKKVTWIKYLIIIIIILVWQILKRTVFAE